MELILELKEKNAGNIFILQSWLNAKLNDL